MLNSKHMLKFFHCTFQECWSTDEEIAILKFNIFFLTFSIKFNPYTTCLHSMTLTIW